MPLYVVATPIGNLSDLSERAKEVLCRADCVASEDTRVTRKLLSALELKAPSKLLRYSSHTEERLLATILERLSAGEKVVLVSDAGTPCISDPGEVLVRACHQEGHKVEVIPGPSSVASALSVSGLPATPHHFLGFPPRKTGPLVQWLQGAGGLTGSLVVLESPQRTLRFVEQLAAVLPDRQVCFCRELTKLHEEVLLLPVAELVKNLQARERIRGEVVLVIGPGEPARMEAEEGPVGSRLKEVAAALAERWGCTKKEAYEQLLSLEKTRFGD